MFSVRFPASLGLLVAGLSACSSGTEPSPLLQAGLYVLQSVGTASPPVVLTISEYPTRETRYLVVYDSIWVNDDTTFARAYSEANVVATTPGQPGDTASRQRSRYSGSILYRDGAVLLIPPWTSPLLPVIELRPAPQQFLRRLRVSTVQCIRAIDDCDVLSDQLVDGVYARR
jgi:hypothetical protein